jgi:hypothetical protein
MLPGPDQIITCPHCGGLAKYRTWLSGTSFGEIAWSDGKREYLGMMPPSLPAVGRCRHCPQCFWLAEARKVGTIPFRSGEDRQSDPTWAAAQEVEEPSEEEYYLALQGGLAKGLQQEKTLRILAWWRRNDGLRYHPAGGAATSGAFRRNLEALVGLLEERGESDRLLKAEVLRELGEFDAAKGLLGRAGSAQYRSAARQLRDLCDRGDRLVRQLSFEESQDVGALIKMAKRKRHGSYLPAIRALGEIGPQAREAVPLLIQFLRDSDLRVAFAARDALREIGDWAEQAAPVLVELMCDEREMVRGLAAKLLGESGQHAKPAIPALQRALEDESCYVRMYAERALRSLGPS